MLLRNHQNNSTLNSRESGRSCTLDVGCWSGSFVMRLEVNISVIVSFWTCRSRRSELLVG